MLDRAAAQHDDFNLWIKQRKVDAGFEPREGCLILRIEEARIAIGEKGSLAAPLDRSAGKFKTPVLDELRQQFTRLLRRQKHCVTQMPPCLFASQNR